MGINFRKSMKILPGVRINFNKNGVGATFGGKVGRVNISSKGTSVGFSVPGTGLSYSKRLVTNGKKSSDNALRGDTVFNASEVAACASQVFDSNSVTPSPSQKYCIYCNSSVPEDALECPFCCSKDFAYRCPQCGTTGTTPYCTICFNEQQVEKEKFIVSAVQEAEVAARTQKAQNGVWWKMLLTFFAPFIGGYFLITPYSHKIYRMIGAIWCIFCALGLTIVSTESILVNSISVILCLLPIAIYLYRLSSNQVEQEKSNIKKYWIGLVLVFVIALTMCFGCENSNTDTENNQQQEESAAQAVEIENQYAEDDVIEEFVLAYNTLSKSPFKELERGNISIKYYGESYGHYVELLDSAATNKINVTIYGKNQKVGVSRAKPLFVDIVRAIDSSITEKEAEKKFTNIIKNTYLTDERFGKRIEIKCSSNGSISGEDWIEISSI